MRENGEPFVFTLQPTEMAQIAGIPLNGSGDLRTLHKNLQEQLAQGNTVTFDNEGLGQLIHYMTRFGQGSLEMRLRRAFARSFLDLFTPIFEAERRS